MKTILTAFTILLCAPSAFSSSFEESKNIVVNDLNQKALRDFDGDSLKVITVMQNEWALLQSSSQFRYLSSNDATSCVMVLWRMSDRSAIAHSHFDIATTVDSSIDKIVNELRKVSQATITVVIAGESSDTSLLSEIRSRLEKHNVTIEAVLPQRNLSGGFDNELFSSQVYSDTLGPIENRWKTVQADFDELKPRFTEFINRHGRVPSRTELRRDLRRVGP